MEMKKFLQKKLKNEKGMTLIELLAVIVIIAIIAAIAIPAIGNIIENSRHGAARADVQNVLSAGSLYFTENGSADGATVNLTTLAPYIDDEGNVTEAVVTKVAGGNTIAAVVDTPQGTYDFKTIPRDNQTLSNMTNDQIKAIFTKK